MAVPLASMFVRVRPQTDVKEFQKDGDAAGKAAGQSYADGFYKDSAGRLRAASGRFATDAEKQMIGGGKKSGAGFGKGFSDTGGGIIKKGFTKLKGELGPLLIPLGVGGAVAAIGKIGTEYENNLNIFQAVTKATGGQMDQVAAKARQLGADVKLPGVSAAGAASAMTELAKAGLNVTQSMQAAQGTLQLARAAGIDEAKAAEITGNALNAFGLQASDTNMIVDELAATANSSSVEIGDVADSFQMAAAVFSSFQGPAIGAKASMTELNTAIAILGNNGIKGSDAGTSLKQMLLQLVNPSKRASNAMQAIAQAANGANGGMNELLMPVKGKGGKIEYIDQGMTLMQAVLRGTQKQSDEALAQLDKLNPSLANVGDIAYDSSGKMRPLKDTIGLLNKGLAGQTQQNRNAALSMIFGSDATRSAVALMKGGLPVWDAQAKAVQQTGAAADVAAAKNKGLSGAYDNVKSQFENAAISIYNLVKGPLTSSLNGFAAALAPLGDDIAAFGGWLDRNSGLVKALATALGIAVSAWVLYRVTMATVIATQKAWAAIQGAIAFIQLAAQVRSMSEAWALLNLVMEANPIGIIVVAVAALVVGVIYAYKHFAWFRAVVQGAWSGIKTAVAATVGWITGTVWPALKAAWSGIAAGATWLYQKAILPAWHGIQAAWQGIAAGALWLWHNVMEPVWRGIMTVVNVVVGIVRGYIKLLVAEFHIVATAAKWLYSNIFQPVFHAIQKIVEIWWLVVRVIFKALEIVIRAVVGGALTWLRNLFTTVFAWINNNVIQPWWRGVKVVFAAFRQYVVGPIAAALTTAKNFFAAVFRAIASYISSWWNANIKPVFAAVRAAWAVLGAAFNSIYNNVIKPAFNAVRNAFSTLGSNIASIYNNNIKPVFTGFIGFIKDKVVGGFKEGVALIKSAWDGVKDAAGKPVKFVVEQVINPFISGLNKAAGIVGIKDTVAPIKLNFNNGGQVPGYASGGRIAGAPSSVDNRLAPATIPGVGAVKLAGGEFVVNARDTAKALPLLHWVNSGMRSGAGLVRRMLGKPMADMPGDGSEGWAFKDGGLVGWAEDAWGAITHPVDTIKKPFEAAIKRIPYAGMVKNFLVGAGERLLNGAISWLTGGSGGGGGNIGKAMQFLHAQDGKPYIWASAGPDGYDCSGIVSAVYNLLRGKSPYSHTFSTESAEQFFGKPGPGMPLTAAWSHPGQAPAGASVGHMMGKVGNLTFESTGSRGVHLGNTTRSPGAFANIGHYAKGGQVVPKLYDGGGNWPSGTLGYNGSGHAEHVMTGGPSGDMAAMLDRLDRIGNALDGLGGDVADALQSPIRRGVTRARTFGPNARYS